MTGRIDGFVYCNVSTEPLSVNKENNAHGRMRVLARSTENGVYQPGELFLYVRACVFGLNSCFAGKIETMSRIRPW